LVIGGILILVAVILLAVWAGQQVAADDTDSAPRAFVEMPKGWRVERNISVPSAQLDQFSKRLGANIVSLDNTFIRDGDRRLQVNVIGCRSAEDARKVYAALRPSKGNSHQMVRRDQQIFEFVCRTPDDMRFAIEAQYRLPIRPRSVTYRVNFDAAPIASGDPMLWNSMFNLCLQHRAQPENQDVAQRLSSMAEKFEFGSDIDLYFAQQEPKWSFDPAPQTNTAIGGGRRFRFGELPLQSTIPFVRVEGTVRVTTFSTQRVEPRSRDDYLQPTPWWPVDHVEIAKLAQEITGAARDDGDKLIALLAWFQDSQNFRFAGQTGSRYGVLKALGQRHGHCWDYADLFVTLARAGGLPCREVMGWLHEGEGHVWCEVAVGSHWRQVDPSSGYACGSDYVPLVVSNNGDMSLLYVSSVSVDVIRESF
ncbi:MAG: transglutaminase domain-containing protein, partial [Planctomycetales bacterium]|nr:transglutaminase domain-containing protein [Planctomycetales bacterium]